MRKIFFILMICCVNLSAQQLSIKKLEKLFAYSKNQVLDSLQKRGYRNLSWEEIRKEEFDYPKDIIFSKTGDRMAYEFRKPSKSGTSKVTIHFSEPDYKKLSVIAWQDIVENATKYSSEWEKLGYTEKTDSRENFGNRVSYDYIKRDSNLKLNAIIDQKTGQLFFILSQ